MTPEQRKSATESLLQARGVPINPHLPCIEPEAEVNVRSTEDVLRRVIALWAVTGAAFIRENDQFREYVVRNGIESWLSTREREFLLSDSRSDQEYVQFSWRLEALYFLAWCAGMVDSIEVPTEESSVEGIMHLFPTEDEAPFTLREHIKLRPKSEMVSWSDLLYRLHWAVRDAQLNGRSTPAGLVAGAIVEWHQAVNWVLLYESEDDWDHVGTDT